MEGCKWLHINIFIMEIIIIVGAAGSDIVTVEINFVRGQTICTVMLISIT